MALQIVDRLRENIRKNKTKKKRNYLRGKTLLSSLLSTLKWLVTRDSFKVYFNFQLTTDVLKDVR